MRICLVGNINNASLCYAELFRKMGHDAHLFVTRRETLHRPESVYPQWTGCYPDWVHDVSHVPEDAFIDDDESALQPILHPLSHGCDLVVLNDVAHSLGHRLCCPYVALITGSDLTYYADYKSINLRTYSWGEEFRTSVNGRAHIRTYTAFINRQRESIQHANLVLTFLRGTVPDVDCLLDLIGVKDQRRVSIMVSNVHRLSPPAAPANPRLTLFNGARVIFDHAKHQGLVPLDNKGTDVLLRGFARYCSAGGTGELRMVSKGQDVPAAKQLIADLNITSRVIWLEEMSHNAFFDQIRKADIVCDQFYHDVPGCVTTDAFALERPVLVRFNPELYRYYTDSPFPGIHAATDTEVCSALLYYEQHPDELRERGKLSRIYAESSFSAQKVQERFFDRIFHPGSPVH